MTATLSDHNGLAGCRILVVDDQAAIRELIRRGLEDAGAEVIQAADGDEAVAAVLKNAPDLVLLDLAMPGRDGWDVLGDLRSAGPTAILPVILQTSSSDLPSLDRARRLGVAAFISKPFRLGELVESCRRVLHGARPFLGVAPPKAADPVVSVQLPVEGTELTARLLDLGEHGAQVELERPLRLGTRVRLDPPPREAEVRWVTVDAGRYHHGLAFRRD